MRTRINSGLSGVIYASALMTILASGQSALAQSAPIIKPGAPGEGYQEISAEDAIKLANNSYSPDDVRFLQDMIPHHNQAVEMAALVADRTNRQEILDVAGRINASQEDEINFMADWLTSRGESVPDVAAYANMHTAHKMAGMASPEDMARLAQLEGVAFDKLFLELMIAHHEGAVKMVEELHEKSGSAYDTVLYEFSNDVLNDQTSEIERMHKVYLGISNDPRASLTAGFRDAGEAAMNVRLVASLPKPPGFFDPENPIGLPPIIEPDDDEEAEGDGTEAIAPIETTTETHEGHEVRDGEALTEKEIEWSERSPLLSFANTDMAFSRNRLVVGGYHGFNVYALDGNGTPELYSSIICPGGQGDVSIVGDLLIMSVQSTNARVDCGLEGISEDVSPDRFRGLRIFDISDMQRPVQVGQVQTCRGSHTHSVVSGPAPDGKIIVYNSGTSSVREEEELEGCIGEIPGDDRTALFRIDVIEIPVDDPSKARIVDSPAVFADPETGRLAGLWQGGDHGDETQETSVTNQCHDITVFPAGNIAGGACSGNGIIFDISDPRSPKRIDAVTDPGFAYWHSATFNNDGTKVIFTDEWGGGSRARCRAYDPKDWGANAIYDIVDGKLVFRSYFKLPAPQSELENCVAHNGSVLPVPGRDIFVQAWYQGGISVIDYTDSANPVEIAYFDRGPLHDEKLILAGFWSAYWYGDKIYASEIVRGLDVIELLPSEYLSENEIAAAALADQGSIFNPQQQFPVSWPAEPVIAKAYLDQFEREGSMDATLVTAVRDALNQSEDALNSESKDHEIAERLTLLAGNLDALEGENQVQKRRDALRDLLGGIAGRLQ